MYTSTYVQPSSIYLPTYNIKSYKRGIYKISMMQFGFFIINVSRRKKLKLKNMVVLHLALKYENGNDQEYMYYISKLPVNSEQKLIREGKYLSLSKPYGF
jgi:hypothetical protein